MLSSRSESGGSSAGGTFHQEIYDLRPWYHDFVDLGLQTNFSARQGPLGQLREGAWLLGQAVWRILSGNQVERRDNLAFRRLFDPHADSHRINQRHKEQILIPFIEQALETLADSGIRAPSGLDLFCADGYYSCVVASRHPRILLTGVDLDSQHIERARTAARVLGFHQLKFIEADVWTILREEHACDLVLCTGGLYHLEHPQDLLDLLRPAVRGFLIVQSVVTLATEGDDFYVTPAPGWKHGSRFTHARLARWLKKSGWHIVNQARNELTGNPRKHDRGSSYFLCR